MGKKQEPEPWIRVTRERGDNPAGSGFTRVPVALMEDERLDMAARLLGVLVISEGPVDVRIGALMPLVPDLSEAKVAGFLHDLEVLGYVTHRLGEGGESLWSFDDDNVGEA